MNYLGLTFSGNFDGLSAYLIILLIGFIIFSLFTLLLSPALIVAGLARRKAENIKNKRVNTIITQYDPPHGLTPAEIGLLYDMRCDKTELIATLFDLEQRGIITIIDEKNVTVVNESAYETLAEYEKLAVRLTNEEKDEAAPQQTIPFTYIDQKTGAQTTAMIHVMSMGKRLAFKQAIQKSLVEKGIKMSSYYGAFALRVIALMFLFGLLPILSASIPGTSNGIEYTAWSGEAFSGAISLVLFMGFFIFPVYALVAITLVWLWTKIAGRYWLNSKQARALWPELEGYKRYLAQVDLDNISLNQPLEIRLSQKHYLMP